MHPLARIDRELAEELEALEFGEPVTHVYNPLVYAREPHEAYLAKYGDGPKEALLLGMNPGPFGMGQTGVPFGDVAMVRDFLGVTGRVTAPATVHARRPVRGFACERSEVSGTRLWGWARDRFGTAEAFFARFFVVNYCPLMFLEESGKNRTPDKLPAAERAPLIALCDAALRRTVAHLRPRCVIGVGAFAEARAKEALADLPVKIGCMLHPSPASPKANTGWAAIAEKDLQDAGIVL